MQGLRVAIVAASLCLSSAAHADWQYTKWGMTPVQVASASKGTVNVGKGKPDQEYEGAEIGATGTFTSGNYSFTVNFHFRDEKLVDVRLNLVRGERYALKNDLLGLYGKPFDESIGGLDLTTWHDPEKNNRVDLLMIGAGYTMLEYRPLRSENTSGL